MGGTLLFSDIVTGTAQEDSQQGSIDFSYNDDYDYFGTLYNYSMDGTVTLMSSGG